MIFSKRYTSSVFFLITHFFFMSWACANEQEDLDKRLVSAVWHLDYDAAKQALAQGADINARVGVYKSTALVNAIGAGASKAFIRYLLENGADVNLQGGYQLPLTRAILNGHRDLVEGLLRRGALTEKLNGYNQNAIDVAGTNRDIALLMRRASEFDGFLKTFFTESALKTAKKISYAGFKLDILPKKIHSPLCSGTCCIPYVTDGVIEDTVSKEALWVLRAFYFDLMHMYHAQENSYWQDNIHLSTDMILENMSEILGAWKWHRVITERQYQLAMEFFTAENLQAIVTLSPIE